MQLLFILMQVYECNGKVTCVHVAFIQFQNMQIFYPQFFSITLSLLCWFNEEIRHYIMLGITGLDGGCAVPLF